MDQERNLSLIEDCFLRARITDEISASSVLKYRDSIKKFFSIVNKDIEDVELRDFDTFILQMKDNGASNSRIANVISAIKKLLSHLLDNGHSLKVDIEKIRKPKVGRKEVNYLTEEEIEMLLGSIKKDIKKCIAIRKVRMMALIVLLLQTGARIGEALSIKISHINRIAMEIPIIGKGNRPRNLYITNDVLYWIDKYLKIRKSDNDYLFTTLDGKSKWSQTDVGRSFRNCRKLSGITKEFVLHTLRHTTATQLANKGVPMNIIQHILGHKRLETTIRFYIAAAENREAKKVIQDERFRFIPKSALY